MKALHSNRIQTFCGMRGTRVGYAKNCVVITLEAMEVDGSMPIANIERRLGRELTSTEARLMRLAEQIFKKESRSPAADSKVAGAV